MEEEKKEFEIQGVSKKRKLKFKFDFLENYEKVG